MDRINPAALPEGSVFHGRYRIVRCINAGGMGAVYECVHLTTRKYRALKVMLPQMLAHPGMRDRFELEAHVTAEIESEHIVETFDAGVDDVTGAPFLVMELLRGEDLDRTLKREGPFPPARVVDLLGSAALALEKTHAAGIVHRDLKPQNLFLTTRDDGTPRLKILDFGIAKVMANGTRTAQQTAALGTPLYMAPEQATGDGRIGPPADLYALGHIAYTLLVGKPYWQEEQLALPLYAYLTRVLAGAPEPPSVRAARHGVAIPSAFDGWFVRATARAPGDRFDRASSLVVTLAAALGTAAPRLPAALAQPVDPDGQSKRSAATPYTPLCAEAPGSGSVGPISHDPLAARPPRSRAPAVALAAAGTAVVAAGLFAGYRALGGRVPHLAGTSATSVAAPEPPPPTALVATTTSAPEPAPPAEPTASASAPPARVEPPRPSAKAAAKPAPSPAPAATAPPPPPRITTPL